MLNPYKATQTLDFQFKRHGQPQNKVANSLERLMAWITERNDRATYSTETVEGECARERPFAKDGKPLVYRMC